MYLLYIDESGDTIPLSQGGKKYLVLTGCVIHEKDIHQIESSLRQIKSKYYQNPEIEFKSNFLRYANPDLNASSILKLNSREKYNELEADMTKYLNKIPTTVYSIVIDKKSYWEQYPSQNPYDIAYVFLLERFQKYLEEKDGLGICIIDPREGQVEKTFIGLDLDKIHNKMRWEDGSVWKKCLNIVERLLFSTSDKTVGIQIADLYCYPIYHVFEYDKTKEEYWRFNEISYQKLYKKNGKIDGVGLKYFPDKTKKDLRFFS
ncbi:hypothetical protein CO009_01730 [Candidatus Shapirobacteria bacterium CG_4_8_14_3_um_filter_35_11]|uniref:DUF3800 domain-containing protein n=1 Tax=Candidatus Shapirobacteria bacterium CG_4_8_14_3_um_filter_35_11 TaxID=1974874 RepID=A0A2M8GJX0_9BACT|nr:MAG: hypothetical protein CO009_01730 [Candidatus Shapirobacteria bacterium CG_4_8_14_3_um_filter_35_11]